MLTDSLPYPTPAGWTDDCQGKKDFDGKLVILSTRYWPARDYRPIGGNLTLPSAKADVSIQYGEPDEYGYTDDRLTLIEAEFEAETEEEVKQQAEAWAQRQMNRIVSVLTNEFATP